jgi:hypothetical protein
LGVGGRVAADQTAYAVGARAPCAAFHGRCRPRCRGTRGRSPGCPDPIQHAARLNEVVAERVGPHVRSPRACCRGTGSCARRPLSGVPSCRTRETRDRCAGLKWNQDSTAPTLAGIRGKCFSDGNY